MRTGKLPWTLLPLIALAAFSTTGQAQSGPKVVLNADDLGPRAIEELTGTNITRAYSSGWQAMEQALEQNRAELLNEQFTGFAKDRLSRRIVDQQRNGLHVKIIDGGHQVKALFYSLDGDAMQLMDEARLEVQVFDGSRMIYSESTPHQYLVLMTPGADRWYIRYLEQVPTPAP